MLKIFLSILFFFSFVFGGTSLAKPSGCDLSQDGKVELNILGYSSSNNTHYTPAHKVGKNFKELFIGSTFTLQDAHLSITNIQANKREKSLPRTGVLSIRLKIGKETQNIRMTYMYEQGHFIALGKQKNSREINFSLYIKALLCYSK